MYTAGVKGSTKNQKVQRNYYYEKLVYVYVLFLLFADVFYCRLSKRFSCALFHIMDQGAQKRSFERTKCGTLVP